MRLLAKIAAVLALPLILLVIALEPLDLLAGADESGERAEIGGIEEHGDLGLTIDGKHCVMRPNVR